MKRKSNVSWIIKVIVASIILSMVFTFISESVLSGAGYITAFILLFVFIFFGVLTDIIGMAVTFADETPFHSMVSHNTVGAAQSIRLIKNAERVSSFCNDVMGDISGIVSGTTGAVICANLVSDFSFHTMVTQLLVTGTVAGLTIGGKAAGKAISMKNSTKIVLAAGKVIAFFERIFKKRNGKKKT